MGCASFILHPRLGLNSKNATRPWFGDTRMNWYRLEALKLISLTNDGARQYPLAFLILLTELGLSERVGGML